MYNPNDLFLLSNPNKLYLKRKSVKSLTSENNNTCCRTLSTSAQLKLNLDFSRRNISKDSNYSSNSYSQSNQSNNSQNNENELEPVKTIIITDHSSDNEYEKDNIPIGTVNETSSFIPKTDSNDYSVKSNTNSIAVSRSGTDKITFKNIACENSNDNVSKNSSLYSLKSPYISKQSSNQSYKRNKTDGHLIKNFSYFLKENKKNNIFDNLTSQISSNENIQNLEEKSKNDNLLNEIPFLSKKILLSNYYNYLKSNLPIVFSKDTENNIINGFSAFTYKND